MDYNNLFSPVGMSIPLRRNAMGSPPRMGKTKATLKLFIVSNLFSELFNFTFFTCDFDLTFVPDSNTGRIITPVLKLFQGIYQNT